MQTGIFESTKGDSGMLLQYRSPMNQSLYVSPDVYAGNCTESICNELNTIHRSQSLDEFIRKAWVLAE